MSTPMQYTPINWKCILTFEENTKGRDFVVGDIHGAYDTLMEALRRANFDPAVDRLFCVGDLIDRGPNSYQCAAFLALPFVHAIRGNHEDMLLELYKDGEADPAQVQWMAQRNGLGWWLTTPQETREKILQAIAQLPLAMEVTTARGTVGFVHGDIPRGMDWPEFLGEIASDNPDVVQTALWGRERIESGNTEGVEGVGRVFVGHTVQWNGLKKLGNVYAVDTGAIFAELGQDHTARLTLANISTQTAVLTMPRVPQLIDVFDAPGTNPFGQYATDIFQR